MGLLTAGARLSPRPVELVVAAMLHLTAIALRGVRETLLTQATRLPVRIRVKESLPDVDMPSILFLVGAQTIMWPIVMFFPVPVATHLGRDLVLFGRRAPANEHAMRQAPLLASPIADPCRTH